MNQQLKTQINNMILSLETFEKYCELSTYSDDGKMDSDEKHTYSELVRLTEKYMKKLRKLGG